MRARRLHIAVVGAALAAFAAATAGAGAAAGGVRGPVVHGVKLSLAPVDDAASVHDPFDSEDCASCHASDDKKAPGPVTKVAPALCLQCHDDPAEGAKHVHDGARCIDCHNPHNSTHEHLLNGAMTTTFYAAYSRDTYALCFSCHDPAMVEAARTTSATDFRNGDLNLHAVHVNRADGKGRACLDCHRVHGGGPKLVAASVAFGSHGWKLPIGFSKTDTGGGCANTCHMARRYDRLAPVPRPAQ